MSQPCETRPVVRYAEYLSLDCNEHVWQTLSFCGSCNCELLDEGHGAPKQPEDVRESFDVSRPFPYKQGFRRFSYCPWCGTQLAPEWWHIPIQNPRDPDHFRKPGTHRGDYHEFRGFPSSEHYLASSDGSPCWCEPTITPQRDGCRIVHKNISKPLIHGESTPSLPSQESPAEEEGK